MGMVLLGVLVFTLAGVHFLWVARARPIIGPETFFLVMSLGTYVASATVAGPTGEPYVLYIGTGIVAFVLGTMTSKLFFGFDHRRELHDFVERPWRDDLRGARRVAVFSVALVSILVTIVYFILLGFYVPWEALGSLLAEGPAAMMATYAERRAQTSVGGAYLGLGYVSQFKDCLLPLITTVAFFQWRLRRSRAHRHVFIVLLAVTVLATMGTGARYHLAFFGAALVVMGLAPFMRPLQFSRWQTAFIAGALMLALSGMTLMMGSRGMDTLDVPILWAPYEVVERVFISPSEQRLEVYERFLVDQPPQWGRGTLDELRQILPGRLPTTLSNRLHELLFGSPYGNVSLDTWGSLWYDFQWFGVLFGFGIGFAMNAYYVWLLRGPRRLLRVVVLSFAGMVLGLATDVQVLVLHGFVTCFLLLAVVEIVDSLGWLQRQSKGRLAPWPSADV